MKNQAQEVESERNTRARELLKVLNLEKIEENLFRGINETPRKLSGTEQVIGRLFGGQVLAQALAAAYQSIEGLDVHSLHGYFLRPGSIELPVLYEVDRIRDGRSFTTRRVVGIQRGQAIFSMSASFHRVETGFEHAEPMPNVPPPEELADDVVLARALAADSAGADLLSPMATRTRPFHSRSVFPVGSEQWTQARRWNPVWIKFPYTGAAQGGNDLDFVSDRVLNHLLLAYASDMAMVSTAALPVSASVPRNQLSMASLDHALWLHQPDLARDWLLMHKHTSVASASRGLVHAEFFSRDGLLVASVTQEGLLRS